MVSLSARNPLKGFVSSSTLRNLAAPILFVLSAAAIEYLIVVYALSIGVRDEACFQIPWLGLTIKPLFHLIPISIVIVLVTCWSCMAGYVHARLTEKAKQSQKKPKTSSKGLKAKRAGFLERLKSKLLRVKAFAYVWNKLGPAWAAVESAIIVLLVFSALALLVSVIANPWLVYMGFVSLYRGNPQLLNSVKAFNSVMGSFAKTIAPVGWICSAIDNALRAAAPGIRDLASSLEALIKPLVDLPPVVKYLIFQNIAAWISSMAVLAYGMYMRKGYRYRKAKSFRG